MILVVGQTLRFPPQIKYIDRSTRASTPTSEATYVIESYLQTNSVHNIGQTIGDTTNRLWHTFAKSSVDAVERPIDKSIGIASTARVSICSNTSRGVGTLSSARSTSTGSTSARSTSARGTSARRDNSGDTGTRSTNSGGADARSTNNGHINTGDTGIELSRAIVVGHVFGDGGGISAGS